MTALNAAIDEVSRLWCAIQPATDGPRYVRLDAESEEFNPEALDDEASDRGFYFVAEPSDSIQETGDVELVETTITASLKLSTQRAGAGIRAAMSRELQALARTVDLQTSWPTGVQEVMTEERAQDELEESTSLATGTITIVLLTEET